jgi:hypothetical protein
VAITPAGVSADIERSVGIHEMSMKGFKENNVVSSRETSALTRPCHQLTASGAPTSLARSE